MEFRKHTLRNQTNRNLIIIAIGFLATVLAGAFVFQVYMGTSLKLTESKLVITVDNQTNMELSNYTLHINNEVFTNFLPENEHSQSFTVRSGINVSIQFTLFDTIQTHNTLTIKDSVAYIFYEITQDESRAISISGMASWQ